MDKNNMLLRSGSGSAAKRSLRQSVYWVSLALALLAMAGPVASNGQPEYAVKVAYLYNFLKFVRWPAESSMDAGDSLNVCMLGGDPFGELIDSLEQRIVRDHPIHISHLDSVTAIDGCALLFVADIDRFPPQYLLRRLEGKGTLLVGDTPNFARSGGMLGLVNSGGKIKLEINQQSLALTNLEVSAMLLEVATLVGGQ